MTTSSREQLPARSPSAVDGAFDLAGALLHRREAVGDREAQVVVAVDAEDDFIDAANVLFEMGDGGGVLAGHGVADRVGDVDGGGADLDDALDDLGEEVQLGAGGVFRRELDVIADGPARWTASTARRTISSLAILSLNSRWMALVARKTWMRGRAPRARASQARSMSSALQRARPQMTGPWTWRAMAWTASKSPGEAMGKPASITSTPSSVSALGDLELLGEVHAGAGRLFAVAQRGVEDDELAGRRGAVVGHEQGLRL